MTAIAKSAFWISPQEYLAGELQSPIRHEYVDGRVFAMSGSSLDHNRVLNNLSKALSEKLRGKKCEAFTNEIKLQLPPSFGDAYYYPDVIVACNQSATDDYTINDPKVIFEILSPSTERTDRMEKSTAYHHFQSLAAYILVEQDRAMVTVLHRLDRGWRKTVIEGLAATLTVPGIGVKLPLARIYERTGVAENRRRV